MQTAEENLERLKEQYKVVYGHCLAYQKVSPDSDNTKRAFEIYKDAAKAYLDAESALKTFKAIKNPP
ncbi:MAG: hypothetical protein ACTIHF_07000 [Streptococcus thermophilus]